MELPGGSPGRSSLDREPWGSKGGPRGSLPAGLSQPSNPGGVGGLCNEIGLVITLSGLAQHLKHVSHVSMSEGDGPIGWAYIGLTDPLGRMLFSGSPEETLAINGHLAARMEFKREIAEPALAIRYVWK